MNVNVISMWIQIIQIFLNYYSGPHNAHRLRETIGIRWSNWIPRNAYLKLNYLQKAFAIAIFCSTATIGITTIPDPNPFAISKKVKV